METIHLKTVDPISQDLLREAGRRGIQLNWDRYETQQPQDGFLRLGLSCPYGCPQGPCRIDPFGTGAESGLCGVNRDQMVAASFLRLTLQGVMERAEGLKSMDTASDNPMIKRASKTIGGGPVSNQDIFSSAGMLSRPSASAGQMIHQAVRLGILSIEQILGHSSVGRNLSCEAGYGLLADNPVVIGVAGRLQGEHLETLDKTITDQKGDDIRVVSLGKWIPHTDRLMPVACTSGEAELLVSSGRINLVIAGPGTDPALRAVCQAMAVPVAETTGSMDWDTILKTAQAHHSRTGRVSFSPEPSLVGTGQLIGSGDDLSSFFEGIGNSGIALIGGEDVPQLCLGWLPVELAKAMKGLDIQVAAWGDAGMWMVKDGLCSDEQTDRIPLLFSMSGVMKAIDALEKLGKSGAVAGICFTGMKRCRDFTAALGLAAIGLRVSVAVPIPLWGSEAVQQALAGLLTDCGGELKHFDHPAEGAEILDWLTAS